MRNSKMKNDNCSTSYSRVVTYHSTDEAIANLTSEIGRDPVCFSMYDRSCWYGWINLFLLVMR